MRRFLVLVSAFAHAAAALAQPAFTYVNSVDETVSRASSIVVGRIAGITHPKNDPYKARLTIAVEKTLMGKPMDSVDFEADPFYGNYIDAYADRREVMLVTPAKTGQPPIFAVSGSPIDSASTADFKIIKDADEFIKEVKQLVAAQPGPSLGNWIISAPDNELGLRWHNQFDGPNPTLLLVPIDKNLLARAKQWVKSGDWRTRLEAFRVFHHFESPDLVPILTPLLSDPGYDVRSAEQNKGIEVRTYRVREEAHRLLVKLGVNVERPKTEESVSRLDDIEILYWWHIEPGELVALRQANRLKEFHTYSRAITQEDLRSLASVSSLTKIVCDWATLSDDDLKLLAGMKNLTSLGVFSANLTDASVDVLASMKSLRAVNLARTKITRAGIERLRKLRPDLYIPPPREA